MAKITLILEDLPEGDADILQIKVESDSEIDKDNLTNAQEMAAMIIGLVEYAREKHDSMSEVSNKN